MKQETKIAIMRDYFIPLIETDFDKERAEKADGGFVKQSEEILAEAYVDEGSGALRNILKVLLPIGIVDVLTPLAPEVYGLILSMVGTWILLIESDILGRYSIAAEAEKTVGGVYGSQTYLNEEEARRLARNTVITNIGLIWLTFGFLLQIMAVTLFGSGEVLNQNFLVQ